MIALLWDVSKPLLAAITAFGATALLVAEFGRGPLLIQRYELGLFAVIAKLAALLTFIFCLLAVGLIIYPATFSDWQLFASPYKSESVVSH